MIRQRDLKLLKVMARQCPVTYRAFWGRKYVLPNYRQGDYCSQDFESWIGFDRLCTFAAGMNPPRDETWQICMANTVFALRCERPTLFLERELGEALLRTAVLANLKTGDINWRWPAFRVYLPKELVPIMREGDPEPRWATYVDISEIDVDGEHYRCRTDIAREIDQFAADYLRAYGSNETPTGINLHRLERTNFAYKEHGMCVGTALNKSDSENVVQTIYAQTKPWGLISLTDYTKIGDDLHGGIQQDPTDRDFLRRIEHLVLNILLFLSAMPAEYEPFHVLRTANWNPKKLQGELLNARFVGDARARAQRLSDTVKKPESQATGRHHAAHWVSGHWRRVVYGEGGVERRLQWIKPYQTTSDENQRQIHS